MRGFNRGKKALLAAFLALAMAPGAVPGMAQAAPSADGTAADEGAWAAGYEPGKVLVVFNQGTSKRAADRMVLSVDSVEDDPVPAVDMAQPVKVAKLDVAEGSTVEEAVSDLQEAAGVAYAQPNYLYGLLNSPAGAPAMVAGSADGLRGGASADAEGADAEGADAEAGADAIRAPLTPQLVGTSDPLRHKQWYLASVNAYSAWDYTQVEGAVTVAVLDTGIEMDHVDLAGRIVAPYDVVGDARTDDTESVPDDSPDDESGHGTHVAGIIAAQANNGYGTVGVSYNANVMPMRVCYYSDAAGNYITSSEDLASAYRRLFARADSDANGDGAVGTYAQEYNVRVVNMSLGALYEPGTDEEEAADKLVLDLVDRADGAGIVTVCAAGNESSSAFSWPADHETCVSVIALDKNDERASYSNFGSAKDIAAPGTDIMSTLPRSRADEATTVRDSEGKLHCWGELTGTSMASPVVAGVAAQVFAANPALSPSEAKEILYSTATDLGDEGFDDDYAHGKVNAEAAVIAAGAEKGSGGSGTGGSGTGGSGAGGTGTGGAGEGGSGTGGGTGAGGTGEGGEPSATAWTGAADTSWYDPEAESFTLDTAEQVAGLALIANGNAEGIAKDSFEGKVVTLGADLDLGGTAAKRAWVPIGDINIGQEHATATDVFFDGTFDGAGHKVVGLYIPSSPENYGGYHAFFGALGSHALVKRLGIESGSVSGRVAAGIAAVSRTEGADAVPQVVGCYNKASIHGNGASSRGSGGIFGGENQKGSEGQGAGYRAAAIIADCYNMGDVESSGPCGGIAGVGSVKLYSCYNTGTVYSTTGGTAHGALVGDLFMKGSVTAAGFGGVGRVQRCFAYVGTDEWLYRILDADHTLNEPAFPGEKFTDDYYNETSAFLDALGMEAAADELGTAFVNDDASAPANDRMPLLWWQVGAQEIDLAAASIEPLPKQLYTGAAVCPALHVFVADPRGGYDSIELSEGSDYRVEWESNEATGTARATVHGLGRYLGSAGTVSFEIVRIDLSTCSIDPILPQWVYGGEARPEIVVRTPDDTELVEGRDYRVSFTGNDATGQATVTVDALGQSAFGQLSAQFFVALASDHLEGEGTEESPYLLSSKGDLQFLSHMVNTDQGGYATAHYRLTGDIDASAATEDDVSIDPIGVNESPFAGSFDGAGHTITLGMDSSKLSDSLGFSPLIFDHLALFSCTGSAGTTTIENLTVDGSVTSAGTAAGFIGSAVDRRLVMRNCVNKATVRATTAIGCGAAGFIGVAAGTLLSMEDCLNEGSVIGSYYASGMVVYLNGGSGQHVFKHCGNAGNVSAPQSAGGIVQHYAPTGNSSFSAENCYNTGKVTSTRKDGGAAGGILGMDQSASQNADLDRSCSFVSCYNAGEVSGGRHGGGIAGQVYTTPMDFMGCYNTGRVADRSGLFGAGGIAGGLAYKSAGWTFSSCYNAGTVEGEKPGGIVGWCYAGSQVKLDNCYVSQAFPQGVGDFNVAQGVQQPVVITGEASVLSDAEMKAAGAGGFAEKLGSIFSDDLGATLNGGYPVCYWQVELAQADLADLVVAAIPDQEYCGGPVTVALDVRTSDGVLLREGVDYSAAYSDNLVPGQASVLITGIGRYTGMRSERFAIVAGDLSGAGYAVADIPDQWGTETGACPALTVTNPAGRVLEPGTDYEVSYSGNVESGTATAVVEGRGHYVGSRSAGFTVVSAGAGPEGSGTKTDPFRIASAADFAYMAAKVNAGEGDYPYAYYELEADLDLEPRAGQPAVPPVGTAQARFRGQFDGAGHEIVLHMDETGPYLGLFGVTDGAVLKRLALGGSLRQTVEKADPGLETLGCAGALVGYAFDSLRVEGCANRASVESNGSAVAGLVGIADGAGFDVQFVGCSNEGRVSTDEFLAAGLLADARAARLVLRDCANMGPVGADNMAAGLVGRVGGSVQAATAFSVTGSYNQGAVMGKYRSGGLVGVLFPYADCSLRTSYNTGAVASALGNGFATYLGTGANGGLVGGVGAHSSLSVDRAYNAGMLSSSDTTLGLGALVGYVLSGAGQVKLLNACYCGAAHSVAALAAGVTAMDSSSALSAELLSAPDVPEQIGPEFGFDAFGLNGGFPIVGAQRADIAACRMSPLVDQPYTGGPVVPAVVVFDPVHGRDLVVGRDYELVCEGNVDVGDAVAHIVGLGSYAGETEVGFSIGACDLADCSVADIPDQARTGRAVEPELEIRNAAGVRLVAGTDYVASYASNLGAGRALAIVRGQGNYAGVLRIPFMIVDRLDISQLAVVSPIPAQKYTGQAVEPDVTVVVEGVPLHRGTEFAVEYAANVEPGTAQVTVTGLGQFCGTVTASFVIEPDGDAGGGAGDGPGSGTGDGTGSGAGEGGSGSGAGDGTGGQGGIGGGPASGSAGASEGASDKKASPLSVKAKAVKAKAKKKTAVKAAKAFKVFGAQGKVTYKKLSGNKKIKVAGNGKVTVKKGLKKGKTYKVKVRVSAAGNASYKPGTKTVTLKVKVK